MAKQGMKRPDRKEDEKKHDFPPVPILQGKARSGKEQANPIIAGTSAPDLKVFHSVPHTEERPISHAYPVIDTDLARDNLENDIPEPDLP